MNRIITRVNLYLSVLLIVLFIVFITFLVFPAENTFAPVSVTQSPPPGMSQENISGTPGIPASAQPVPSEIVIPEVPPLPADPIPTFSLPAGQVTSTLPSVSKISIREEITPKGITLIVTGSDDISEYRFGPLARGAYAVGPNDRFLVYITNSGQVYAIKFGESSFVRIANLRRSFTAIIKNTDPAYRLSFYDSGLAVTLIISEENYGQTVPVILPRAVTY
jgi:hypothetical protein